MLRYLPVASASHARTHGILPEEFRVDDHRSTEAFINLDAGLP